MKPKILLSLALVLSGVLFGCSTTPNRPGATVPPGQIDERVEAALRQRILRDASTNPPNACMVQMGSTWEVRYSVPADAAEILESRPSAELLPFLAQIRKEPPPWREEVVDEWIGIVRERLRGTPAILRAWLTTPEGVALPRRDIPVYNYTRMIQVTNKIPMQSQAELMDGFNILAEWGANMALGLLTVEIRRPKGGSPILAGDVKVRVFDNKGAKVECDPKAPDTDGTVSYGNGDVSTAVIFFKIKTDHPESLAIVEATYKNKVHVLELRDVPRPYSGDN